MSLSETGTAYTLLPSSYLIPELNNPEAKKKLEELMKIQREISNENDD